MPTDFEGQLERQNAPPRPLTPDFTSRSAGGRQSCPNHAQHMAVHGFQRAYFAMLEIRKSLQRLVAQGIATAGGWKPHPKSMEMNRLAGHVAELPRWATHTVKLEQLDITPQPGQNFEALVARSREKLLQAFDRNVAEAREAISGVNDDHLSKTWTLIFKGKPLMQMPRAAILRGMVMNHLIHHRAQLGVYLRLNEVPIPGMYGASADEPSIFRGETGETAAEKKSA